MSQGETPSGVGRGWFLGPDDASRTSKGMIMARVEDFDPKRLAKAAAEALTRPNNSMLWDDRPYTTHGAVISWAERGDDLLEESNYLCALDRLRAAADDGRDDTEVSDEHVIDATIRDWLVGSLRQIFVQVYEDVEIGPRRYTPAFLEAVAIEDELRDYPILDESDYSEREFERFEKNLVEALADVHGEFEHDTEADQEAIRDHAREDLNDTWEGGGDLHWDRVAEVYREHRDSYFTELAREHFLAQLPGQLSFELSV